MENDLDNMKTLMKINTRVLSKKTIPYIVRNRETKGTEAKGRKGKALQCLKPGCHYLYSHIVLNSTNNCVLSHFNSCVLLFNKILLCNYRSSNFTLKEHVNERNKCSTGGNNSRAYFFFKY